MNYEITVKDKHGEWTEEHTYKGDMPENYFDNMIRVYNVQEKHRYGDKGKPRTLVKLEKFHIKSFNTPHDWGKTSLVTELGGYDKYKCKVCGITGKRHGLSSCITRDAKYKPKVYTYCDRAKKHLENKLCKP